MKVTRLKSGYSIRVSDSEYEVMRILLGDMLAGEIDEGGMAPCRFQGIQA